MKRATALFLRGEPSRVNSVIIIVDKGLAMCGRFTLTAKADALNPLFPSLFDGLDVEPSYNVAPTQQVLAARQRPDGGQLEAVRLRWGLVPSWADDLKIGYKLINARADTVRDKPAFRSAFKHRRCLILADGFYEWKQLGAKTKQPFHLRLVDGGPFAFAGLWEYWQKDGQNVESCTILTTDANATVQFVHNRMPVIVDPANHRAWLDAASGFADFSPHPAERMTAVAVGTLVNNVRHNDADCLTPANGD